MAAHTKGDRFRLRPAGARPRGNRLLAVIAALWLAACGQAAGLRYRDVPGWLKLPPGKALPGNQHGDIAVSANGEVYISFMDPRAGIQVYGPDGSFRRSVPGAPDDFHGFIIHREAGGEFIYGARLKGESILKLTLGGRVVLEIPGSAIPDRFKLVKPNGKPYLRLTDVAVAPNGDIYASDGYASDYIHRFDRNGRYLSSFGGKAAPYGFRTLHKLAIDPRFSPARLLCCDRKNLRLVHLSLDGKFLGVFARDLLLPSAVAIQGENVAVAELDGRVTVLDRAGRVLVRFGANSHPAERGTNRTPPALWRPGIFNAPHGIAFDARGDLFISEWSLYGRVFRFDRQ